MTSSVIMISGTGIIWGQCNVPPKYTPCPTTNNEGPKNRGQSLKEKSYRGSSARNSRSITQLYGPSTPDNVLSEE
jgi:hypothetical protein